MEENGQKEVFYNTIIEDMGEGILTLGLDGRILIVNPAAEEILGIPYDQLYGKKFSTVFFQFSENDLFNQTILDAIYDADSKHESVVPYYDGVNTRYLHILTSFLTEGEARIGIVAVISDLTELKEMEAQHIEEINTLIESMVKTLSTAIDERSHYTGRHTQNMVSMGEAFLNWLKERNDPWQFNAEQRRALLMSIWLHDVGKIAIPLEIMDKATRLGSLLEVIENRFSRIRLLDRIAYLEGRLTQEEYNERQKKWPQILSFIRKINTAGFVTDENLQEIHRLTDLTYTEEDGHEEPLFTNEEIENLSIRKGTLTDRERQIMQSHSTLTRRILDQVSFPCDYTCVPLWASSHHELLNGHGYPDTKTGDMIPREVQLITILDIFEALTAKDRPYKPPIPLEKAWAILDSMVREGSLNGELLAMFRESGAWKVILSPET